MTRLITTDVLVAGLGPAGATAGAAIAAASGYQVIAVDRKVEAGVPVQCAEFVPAMIGREVGALATTLSQSISAMTTYVEDESADIHNAFPGYMIDRAKFDQRLVQAAEQAGVDCRFATAVVAVDADGVVSLGSATRIKARVIIGADGPRSKIGASIGAVNRELVASRQISVPLLIPHAATDIFLARQYQGGYAWLFPKGASANVGLGVAPSRRHRLKTLLGELHAALVAEGRCGRDVLATTGGAIPVGGLLRAHGVLGASKVMLCGDAAGLTNPVTGAGINSAVLSGALAADAAIALLDGDSAACKDYQQELEDLFRPALDRAVRRRQRLLETYHRGTGPSVADLRSNWIAYPQYWAA